MVRKDIMVDIETLGTKEGASIFQISAASFNINNGEIYDTIDLIGDVAKYSDLYVDGSTLKWWLTTDSELFASLLNRVGMSEKELAVEFNQWVLNQGSKETVYLWGNGILFDNAKLQTFLTNHDIKYPILYKNDRDVRTILDLAASKLGVSENVIRDIAKNNDDILHDAFSDVKRQIRLVTFCHNAIMKEEL